ncbi:MAG: CinA family nicotinamide mononucleotide deamidase-related protein [Planctomycetes bacterium]|nr:CinA family nicotinamide mononucleotide deamidase-related protein [Planctomycetota bacterium]
MTQTPRQACIVAVGSEVVQGYVVNTNAAWLAQELAGLGWDVVRHEAVTDREADITHAVKAALEAGLLVVVCGGIGPTVDDRTRQAAAAALGLPLRLDHDDLARLQERYSAAGRRFPEGSEIQCMRPEGARLVPNAFGTASCFLARHANSGLCVLPGVPRELKGIWAEEMRAALVEEFGVQAPLFARELKCFGLPESDLNNRVRHLLEDPRAEGAILVDDAVIRLRWRAAAQDQAAADQVLEPLVAEAAQLLGDLVIGTGDVTLEQVTVQALRERGLRVALAESCTGGMVAHLLTNVPGSSDVLLESCVVYANEAKQRRLGVKPETLAGQGAVSEAAVLEMLQGLNATGAQLRLAVSGIAGPGGGTPEKPVGTVWLAAGMGDTARAWRLRVPGDRELVKWRSARAALNTLRLAALHNRLPEHPAQWFTPPV